MRIIQGNELYALATSLRDKIHNANSIRFYCQNFSEISNSSNHSLLSFIVSELKENYQKTIIYSLEYIHNLETPLHQDTDKKLQITKIKQEGALANFFSTIIPPNKYKNLKEALQDIEYSKLKQALNQLKVDLKQELANNESKLGEEYAPIKEDISKDLDEVFEQLQKHFQNINNNQNKQIARTALALNFSVFVGVLSLLVAPVGIGIALTGLATAEEVYSYQKNKDEIFSYSLNPILKFLTHKTAVLITLIYPQFYNTTLVLDDEFYEFLGTDLYAIPSPQNNHNQKSKIQDSFISEQVVFYDKFSKSSSTYFDNFFNTKQSFNQTQQIQLHDNALPLKNSLETIKKKIQELHHFAYIETPCFNAIKLADLFKVSLSDNNASKTQKGILIISENPTKHNAGLSEYITQSLLSNKIKRGTSSKKPTIKSGQNTYNAQRDFSDYKIAIRANDSLGKTPFVLQLAPFAIKPLEEESNPYAQDYINSCFRQPQDVKQIVEKENELLKVVFQKIQEKWTTIQNRLPKEDDQKILLAILFAHLLSHMSLRFGHIQDFEIQWEEEQCIIKYGNKSFCIKDFEVIEEQISEEEKTIKKQNFIPILKAYYDAYITFLNTSTKPSEKVPDLQQQVNQETFVSSINETILSILPITQLIYAGSSGWDNFLFTLSSVALGVLKDGKKNLTSPSLESLITPAFNALLNYLIKNKKDLFKKENEWLIHQHFTYFYDLPLALKRDFHQMQTSIPSIFYPIKVKPTLFSLDLSTTFFGGRMDSSSYENQLGWLYKIPSDFSLVSRILKYLIIDELRSGKLNLQTHIGDEVFFQRDFTLLRAKDYMFDMDKQEHRERAKQYQTDSRESGETSLIEAYNTALKFLSAYQEDKMTSDSKLSIAFLKALDMIGENNIKALYVGTSEESKNKKRPLFVGRLATTIIIEDGLWIG